MDFDKVLKERRSIRNYSIKKISFGNIISVCESARFAPMAGNIYTLKLILVSDKKKKHELSEASLDQEFISKAPYVIVVCSDTANAVKSFGETAKIFIRQQAGAAIENMLLKTTSLDLATCWIGAFDENAVKRILKIPDNIQVEAILPIAKQFGKEKAKKKPDLKMILHFEKWGQRTSKPEKKVSS